MFRKKHRELSPSFWIATSELPTTPANAFFRRLDAALAEHGFDDVVREKAAPFYETDASKGGQPGIDPAVYTKMMLVGFFENLPSDRAVAARCADSLAIRDFLHYSLTESVPHHSSLSVIRKRLSLEAHVEIFNHTLELLREAKLLKGRRLAIDTSVMEANASLRSLEHRLTGEKYREYVKSLAKDAGVDIDDPRAVSRFDRKRPGRTTSNEEWVNPHDKDAKVGPDKKGVTRMTYKTEHVVDMDTGAVLTVAIKPGDEKDSADMAAKVLAAEEAVNRTLERPADALRALIVAADMGYHDLTELGRIQGAGIRTAVSDPVNNRNVERLSPEEQEALKRAARTAASHSGKAALRRRGQSVERSFAHLLDCGGERRTTLRGRENVAKRYVLKAAGLNIALVMRKITGLGTLKQTWAATGLALEGCV
jgi:transposase